MIVAKSPQVEIAEIADGVFAFAYLYQLRDGHSCRSQNVADTQQMDGTFMYRLAIALPHNT
jgi:hypothetical protein